MRLARPWAELLGIIQQPVGHSVIGQGGGDPLFSALIGERLRAFRQEIPAIAIASLQVNSLIDDQADHLITDKDAFPAEHGADRYPAKVMKKIVETVRSDSPKANGMVRWTIPSDGRRELGRAAVALHCCAGVIETDSPQPQADVWFGLLNTNRAPSFSFTKSSSVPIKNRIALGSMKILTPLSSITSSNGFASEA